jgi:hypothetical protein
VFWRVAETITPIERLETRRVGGELPRVRHLVNQHGAHHRLASELALHAAGLPDGRQCHDEEDARVIAYGAANDATRGGIVLPSGSFTEPPCATPRQGGPPAPSNAHVSLKNTIDGSVASAPTRRRSVRTRRQADSDTGEEA